MDSEELTRADIQKYITWVLEECNAPYDEIEWLVQHAIKGQVEAAKNLITSIIKTIKQ